MTLDHEDGAVRAPAPPPDEMTSFVGRRREVGQVRQALADSRLVTLAGPGGIGKTWLALQVAGKVRRSFPDGVLVAELASLSDPDEIVLLQTLREYGRQRLAASGEEAALRERHRDWCQQLARRLAAEWFGPDQMRWFARLRREQSNLRAALEYCATEPGQARAGLRLAAALWFNWSGPGSVAEGRRWLDRLLALDSGPSPERAHALFTHAWLAVVQGRSRAAARCWEEYRTVVADLESDSHLERRSETLAGLVALMAGDCSAAVPRLETALSRHEAAGDLGLAAVTSFMLALACFSLGDPAGHAHAERCLDLGESHQAPWSRSRGLWITGLAHHLGNRPDRARTRLRASLALIRSALRDWPLFHDPWVSHCLEVLAWCAEREGQAERGATLLGAAEATWELAGATRSGFDFLQAGHERCQVSLREELGEDRFLTAFRAGERLTPDQAVAYALEEGTSPPLPERQVAPATPLSRRETQVARLVAKGLTNRDIAAELVISARTAEGHVERILSKLGFTSRSQIAAWSVRGE
ncbi:LuxR C-terminal-related transcriptional regulator [Streptomyces sp. NPDC048664]|uniref:LuxR C-terminal-related transcriptional regulator n=1 Tax=Streptomyces sp. NPDC048664 TaxID=3154505 RepID=UPI003414E51E